MESLKDKTAKGLFWGAINSGCAQLLNIIIGIFLARLLSPADYGIAGMLTLFTLIANTLQESGFTTALINKKNVDIRDYNAVFWFCTSISILLYIILFLCAPLIAAFFHQPDLTNLARFTFFSFMISAISIPHNAFMTKKIMNKEKTIIGICAFVLSGITGITLAYLGMAYWSLAWQSMIYITIISIGRLYYTPWRPTFQFNFSPIHHMFRFSANMLATNIAAHINNQLLTFIFGRLFTPIDVGNFSQANKWKNMASGLIQDTISQVAQPILATVTDEKEREKRVFRKMTRFAAFLSFPTMFGLILVSDEFITITLSEKWAICVPFLRILCLSGAFSPFHVIYQNVVITHGRSDIYMRNYISQVIAQISIVLSLYCYGTTTMVAAFAGINIIWLATWQHFAHRMINLRVSEVLLDIFPFAIIAAATMLTTYIATIWIENIHILLGARIIIAVFLYYAAMRITKVKIFKECTQFVIQILRR